MADRRHLLGRSFCRLVTMGLLLGSACPGLAQPPGGEENILFAEIPSVFTASKYEQKVTAAPSAVSIITAAEIRKYGYRTLADILRSQRGFYTSYDRQTEFLGVRGFGRPGDFNSRILLLIDGSRSNNNIFDTAAIGNDFILDVALIDRIEVVRGPGSSLYGSNAFFAVINVITRRGRDLQGTELAATAASQETYRGRLSYGRRFPGGGEFLLSGSSYRSNGDSSLYYAEFDAPETNAGVATDRDGEKVYTLFGKVSLGDFTLETAFGDREKETPTGAFGTVFNDPRNRTSGRQASARLHYQHLFPGELELLFRASYEDFRAEGDYVYDFAPVPPPLLVVNQDRFRGEWWGSEFQLGKSIGPHHLVAGGEYRDNFRQDLQNSDLAVNLDSRQQTSNIGLFLQDEYRVGQDLSLSLGVRCDRFSTFGWSTSPRLALIYTPRPKTALKFLYGQAFRAPSAFENYYHDGLVTQKPNPDLDPETIRTWELVWEQYFGDALRAVATGYYYRIDDLINLTLDPADGLLVFRNLDKVEARGLELELEGRLNGGWEGRGSYTLQRAEDQRSGETLSNAPRHLVKFGLVAPLVTEYLFLAVEERYTSSRRTVSGRECGGFAITNLTLSGRKLLPGLELTLSLFNLFDKRYSDPVSAAHLQDSIVQDGRTIRGQLTYSF
ncbi:catecholate siderophore receptor CirA [Desulfuromonas carbonis]